MFLESFTLPDRYTEEKLWARKAAENGGRLGYVNNEYPCGIFSAKGLSEVYFAPVTIFYGGNGSGKSTLLNLIAEKLHLTRMAPFNSSEMFALYAESCGFDPGYDDEGRPQTIPEESRIITSDDIFDYMLAVRTNNEEIASRQQEGRDEWARLKFGDTIKLSGMQDYEALRMQVLARSKSVSRRAFLRKTAGSEVRLISNGETALKYFETTLLNDSLYCLDEPENSMSPKMQQDLVHLLTDMSRYCGCQLIIATHSPFLLALEGARVYDLDTVPVTVRPWWELENVRVYYDFFMSNRTKFDS